jgi:hypothetical protein
MLSFVWVRAGSTIKSRRRTFTSATLKSICIHIRQRAASFLCQAPYPTGGEGRGARSV